MELMGLGFWAILGFVTLLGYLFLVGIVSSVVFLDNVLPRIPNQTEISTRTRARDVNFTSGISKLSDPISGEVENFETLILQFSSKTRAGRIENIREASRISHLEEEKIAEKGKNANRSGSDEQQSQKAGKN